ncbi:hypothetical protein SS50377_25202 [Spironucleus salmonicida]|uniref:Uncharacterized protein n=1 Tax=Spironucleus salmonicida TaxID=348837 RepID=V6M116_9EUKA|nr:hypothetical protein SS50377_25202 [Spironucleus salmonicida]|eukprot:EST46859.1 Hypothetical protein SS50377_13122 [Spironucleus salmonicida]
MNPCRDVFQSHPGTYSSLETADIRFQSFDDPGQYEVRPLVARGYGNLAPASITTAGGTSTTSKPGLQQLVLGVFLCRVTYVKGPGYHCRSRLTDQANIPDTSIIRTICHRSEDNRQPRQVACSVTGAQRFVGCY